MKPENLGVATVTVYRLTRTMAEKRIRTAAANSDNVILGNHALERMDERGILDIQVFDILKMGTVSEDPKQTKFKEWQCKVTKRLKGTREAGVVTIILHSGRLFIKTVEWEDFQ